MGKGEPWARTGRLAHCLDPYNVPRPAPPPTRPTEDPPMKRSSFALPFVALASALVAACVFEISDSGLRFDGIDFGGVSVNENAQRSETHALELGPGESLTLDTSYGDVEVAATGEGAPELRATIHASGRTVEEAQAVLQRFADVSLPRPNGPSPILVVRPLRVRGGGASIVLASYSA